MGFRAVVTILLLTAFMVRQVIAESDHDRCAPRLGDDHQTEFIETNEGPVLLFEGDILIGDEPGRAGLPHGSGQSWINSTVPFVVQADIPDPERVYEALGIWSQVTGDRVRFVERSDENDYVVFTRANFNGSSVCSSFIGRRGGAQILNVGDLCGVATLVHEVGHVLGLWHEQSRNDRDHYVRVLWCHIAEKHRHNFVKYADRASDFESYDFNSIMHYTSKTFSKNGAFTLESRDASIVIPEKRQNPYPSRQDVRAVLCFHGDEMDSTESCPQVVK